MTTDLPEKGGKRPLRIGKYEVLHHVASGGMGSVYKAIDIDLGREVALKVLPPELAANPKATERFRREAKAAARLRHDNIVAIYEFGEAAGTYFLALEFVDGINLHDYIQLHGRLKPDLARDLLKQAAKALAHAHSQGIVHRDIKPSNFLLADNDGHPVLKLTDLGLALRGNEDKEARVTTEGTTVGTVDYMSPEQAHDSRAADIRSDLYSLGCTFYHMLAGHPPFPEGSLIERLTKHVRVEPQDIRQLNSEVPEDLAHVLDRMLRKQPEHRYQTPLELLRDLLNPEQIDYGPRLLPLDEPTPPAEKRQRELWGSTGGEKRKAVAQTEKTGPSETKQRLARANTSMSNADTEVDGKTRPTRKRRPNTDEVRSRSKNKKRYTPQWIALAALTAVWLLAGTVVAILLITQTDRPPKSTETAPGGNQNVQPGPPRKGGGQMFPNPQTNAPSGSSQRAHAQG